MVVPALVGGIVAMSGLIIWAVKFTMRALVGSDSSQGVFTRVAKSIEGLRGDVQTNTACLQEVKQATQSTHQTLLTLVERSPVVGEETLLHVRKDLGGDLPARGAGAGAGQ